MPVALAIAACRLVRLQEKVSIWKYSHTTYTAITFLLLLLRLLAILSKMPRKPNGDSAGLRSRSKAEKETQDAHDTIKKAQNTEYNHSYGHVDMSDDQIIGGGKERALTRYDPGIVITEKGREQDKKLDEHYE